MSATRKANPGAVAGGDWIEITAQARRLRSAYLGALVRDAFAALTASRRAR
ncbi:MAG: hypothetical protein V3R88_05230 [Alphaproteobacteria bacterium]